MNETTSERPLPPDFHKESRPCPECGATMLYDEGEPWEGASWGCTGCGHSESVTSPLPPGDTNGNV